jgi:hypothetical protein
MDTQRRGLLAAIAAIGTATLADTALGAEAKPFTTAGLAKSLLTLADKAELQGMTRASYLIQQAAREILKGEPIVPCDTDSDCERKNPRLARKREVTR